MWQQSGSNSRMNYKDAHQYIADLNAKEFGDYNDWRLPTLEEVMSLMEPQRKNGDLYIDPILDKTQRWIWTSDHEYASRVWVVTFFGGHCRHKDVEIDHVYVRAVRS